MSLGNKRAPLDVSPLDRGALSVVLLLLVTTVLLALESVFAMWPRVRPDVATLVVVYLALERELILGMLMSLGVGYLADLFSGVPLGLYTSTSVLVFLGLRLIVFRIGGARWLVVTGIGLISTLAALVLRFLIQALLAPTRPSLSAVSPALFALLVGPLVFGYPFYWVLRLIDDRFKPREETALGNKS